MLNGKLHENLNKKNNLLNRYINSPGEKVIQKGFENSKIHRHEHPFHVSETITSIIANVIESFSIRFWHADVIKGKNPDDNLLK